MGDLYQISGGGERPYRRLAAMMGGMYCRRRMPESVTRVLVSEFTDLFMAGAPQ
jgi:hypothetical protein